MHPAYSVVFFTAASGAGYGLLAATGVLGSFGLLPPDRWLGGLGLGLALLLISAGLLASLLHLGHAERAWRALSQWRSSWLSREGVAAVATYVPAVLYAAGWVLFGNNSGPWAILGLLSAVAAAITVYCTAMIYASLKPIPRWRNRWVIPGYFALALATGLLLLAVVAPARGLDGSALPLAAALATLVAGVLKLAYWREIDAAPAAVTAEQATGLGRFGSVRLLEAPHMEENYLMREMGYRIARKHAARLRSIALVLAFGLPTLAALAAAGLAGNGFAQSVLMLTGAVLAIAGVLIERWLFFAEAKHAVTLYYGASGV